MRMEKGELMWVCPRSFTERRMVNVKYVPILEELFSSDSVIFLLIGLVIGILISIRWKEKNQKNHLVGLGCSVVVYVLCEVFSNIPSNFLIELLLLFVGTTALGLGFAFLLSLVIRIIIRKNRY